MKWHGDSPVKYTNWEDSTSPSDLVPMDTCVALNSKTGKWENVSCMDDVENGVICETNQSKSEKIIPIPVFYLFENEKHFKVILGIFHLSLTVFLSLRGRGSQIK